MSLIYSEELRNAQLNEIASLTNTGAALKIWGDPEGYGIPASESVAIADLYQLLVRIELPNPAFEDAVDGTLSKTGSWVGTATTDGNAAFFTIDCYGGDATTIIGSVGTDADNDDLVIDDTALTTGQNIRIDSFKIDAGNVTPDDDDE